MRKLIIIASLVILVPLLGAGGCASASKQEQPALVIPPPPPRVVPITPEPVLEPVADVPSASGSGTPAVPRPGSRGTREAAARPQPGETKTETKPEAPVAEVPLPAPVAPPSGPPPQLRTTESPGTEGTVRATVARARQILSTVDYRRLNSELRKAYDDAKKFADQADEALKQGNVVFAQGVAGKAETLAKELAGRL